MCIFLYMHTIYKTNSSYLLGGVGIRQIEDIEEKASQVALVVKNLPANAGDVGDPGLIPELGRSPGEGMATHSSILVWRILWTEDPGRLQSIRVTQNRT